MDGVHAYLCLKILLPILFIICRLIVLKNRHLAVLQKIKKYLFTGIDCYFYLYEKTVKSKSFFQEITIAFIWTLSCIILLSFFAVQLSINC